MIIELQSKLSYSNSLWVIVQVKRARSAECVPMKYGEILKMGWEPAHEGARFEGDDPPEMKSWLRHCAPSHICDRVDTADIIGAITNL